MAKVPGINDQISIEESSPRKCQTALGQHQIQSRSLSPRFKLAKCVVRSCQTKPVTTLPIRCTMFILMMLFLSSCATSSPSANQSTNSHSEKVTSNSSTPNRSTSNSPTSVVVLYAGSLLDLMQYHIDPAFHSATGNTVDGFAGGSDGLASEIKGKIQRADIFISAAPSVNASLMGKTNGDWVNWYATFATSPLELGYNPHSPFVRALRSKPWYDVVDQPGFALGRTDPSTDPKGTLSIQALLQAAAEFNRPDLREITHSSSNVFPEATLVGRLQAGQLDAGFFYGVEAKSADLPTVPLVGINESATFTVTVLANAPHPLAAQAFVKFLLGKTGSSILRSLGLTPLKAPTIVGSDSKIPVGLKSTLVTHQPTTH